MMSSTHRFFPCQLRLNKFSLQKSVSLLFSPTSYIYYSYEGMALQFYLCNITRACSKNRREEENRWRLWRHCKYKEHSVIMFLLYFTDQARIWTIPAAPRHHYLRVVLDPGSLQTQVCRIHSSHIHPSPCRCTWTITRHSPCTNLRWCTTRTMANTRMENDSTRTWVFTGIMKFTTAILLLIQTEGSCLVLRHMKTG